MRSHLYQLRTPVPGGRDPSINPLSCSPLWHWDVPKAIFKAPRHAIRKPGILLTSPHTGVAGELRFCFASQQPFFLREINLIPHLLIPRCYFCLLPIPFKPPFRPHIEDESYKPPNAMKREETQRLQSSPNATYPLSWSKSRPNATDLGARGRREVYMSGIEVR